MNSHNGNLCEGTVGYLMDNLKNEPPDATKVKFNNLADHIQLDRYPHNTAPPRLIFHDFKFLPKYRMLLFADLRHFHSFSDPPKIDYVRGRYVNGPDSVLLQIILSDIEREINRNTLGAVENFVVCASEVEGHVQKSTIKDLKALGSVEKKGDTIHLGFVRDVYEHFIGEN